MSVREPRGPRAPALHHQGRPARQLPLRHVRGAAARHRAHPLHLGHHRQAHRRRLHAATTCALAECVARLLAAGGVTEHDVVQIAFNYGLFTGGLRLPPGGRAHRRLGHPGLHRGPWSGRSTIMRDFKTTALACTPGYALHLASPRRERRVHPSSSRLRAGILRRRALERGAARADRGAACGITAMDNYGLTEVIGPGVSVRVPDASTACT